MTVERWSHHSFTLRHKPKMAFGIDQLVPSTPLPSPLAPYSSPPSSSDSRRSSCYSLPNWTRLVGAADGADGDDANTPNATNNTDNVDSAGSGDITNDLDIEICSHCTPHEASVAYLSGLLKSDYNISSNSTSIRAAFRYVVDEGEKNKNKNESALNEKNNEKGDVHVDDGDEGDEDDEASIYLCWVNQNGSPRHFYHLSPTKMATIHSEACDRGEILMVNEKDHIENTFPGHAFVFCRKIPNVGLDDGDDHHRVGESPVVLEKDGKTIFLRRVKRQEQKRRNSCEGSDEGQMKEDSVEGEGGKESEESIEAFLLVGGYRFPKVEKNGEVDAGKSSGQGDHELESEGKSKGKGDKEEERKSENDKNVEKEEDESDDEGEDLLIRLVTIKCTHHAVTSARGQTEAEMERVKNVANAKNATNASDVNDTDNVIHHPLTYDDDDDPPPKLYDCSSCLQPLQRIVHPKFHHESAFRPFYPLNAAESIELPSGPLFSSQKKSGDRGDSGKAGCDAGGIKDKEDSKREVVEEKWEVTACLTRVDPSPVDTSCKHYDQVVLGGWPCRLEPGCFPPDEGTHNTNGTNHTNNSDNTTNLTRPSSLRARFESDLRAATLSLPPHARLKLQTTTPIWINRSQTFGPKAAPTRGRDACFHPGSKWLVRNGMNPAKCGGVEFYDAEHYLSDCDLWGPGGLILHELSHAWHCLHVERGYANPIIKGCYERAMNDKLYDCVPVHGPQGPKCKAYACQDQMEYFAELSVAFLGGVDEGEEEDGKGGREHNKWFPFNRRQVREHDPRAFEMLCRIWGVELEVQDDLNLNLEGVKDSSGENDGGEGSKES